jgi:hypothetical protein
MALTDYEAPGTEAASSRGDAGESQARGTVFGGLRQAALEVFGEAGYATLVAALPADARAATVDSLVVAVGWYPERYVMAWFDAAFERAALRNDARFHAFLDRMMDHGFGRIRRALLRLASPNMLLAQATTLWSHDHSHGSLSAEVERGAALLVLRNHVYTTDPVSRSAVTEIYRYGVALTGVRQVLAVHHLQPDGSLQVKLRWGV